VNFSLFTRKIFLLEIFKSKTSQLTLSVMILRRPKFRTLFDFLLKFCRNQKKSINENFVIFEKILIVKFSLDLETSFPASMIQEGV